MSENSYEGLETTLDFLTPGNQMEFQGFLESTGLKLGAFGMGLAWLNEDETQEEFELANQVIAIVKKFPGTLLMLSHTPVGDRTGDLLKKQRDQIGIVNKVARRAAKEGLSCAYHANSADNALFRTNEDYNRLISLLDTSVIGWAPDIGHMANGNCDIMGLLFANMPLIKHVHYKDMLSDHSWTPMGKGIIDYVAITELLRSSNYSGWIMVEDESPESKEDPDAVAAYNACYIRDHLALK
jgi:inosose dehydratase